VTKRAVALGFAGAIFICAFTYFNDTVLRQTPFCGNYMPLAVYGGLIAFVLALNPLLKRLRPSFALAGSELAVVMAITLAACAIPGHGFMRTFTTSAMIPHNYQRILAHWRSNDAVDMVPPEMLADVSEDHDRRLNGFMQGLPVGQDRLSLGDIPWGGWWRTLLFWLPLALTLWIACIGVALVVHRQWSRNEHLPYPIATFTESLLPNGGGARGSVFTNKLFLYGMAAVFALHLNNYIGTWFPGWIRIPLGFNFGSLVELFPNLKRGGGWFIFWPKLYFTPIAFAYFLATSVSFSLGIGPVLFVWVHGILAGYGMGIMHTGWPGHNYVMTAGSFVGTMAVLLYAGRHYYKLTFKRAIGLKVPEEMPPTAVWGMRVLLGAFVMFVFQVMLVGLDWFTAVFLTTMMIVLFTVVSRITAETGVFFVHPWWEPTTPMVALLGASAFGPKTLAVMVTISAVLAYTTPRATLMPFVTNALRVLDRKGVRLGRSAVLCGVALVVGLAVAVPATLYWQYDSASHRADSFSSVAVPAYSFEQAITTRTRLKAQGTLAASESASGLGRLLVANFDGTRMLAFAAGIVLVAVCAFARWRLTWWPLHPVAFLVWTSWTAGQAFAASLLVGCLIKFLVVKYGGDRIYQKLKPLMFGLIAGDMLGGLFAIFVGYVYYLATGSPPMSFSVLPG